MEVRERWILVFFLIYLAMTFLLSRGESKETFIERELSLGEAKQIVSIVQDRDN